MVRTEALSIANSNGKLAELAEEKLLADAIGGDRAALTQLLDRFGTQVRNGLSIAQKWQGVLDADDVMQVTYIEVFLRVRDFKPGRPGSFLAWLRRIAENNLRDAIRELEREKRTPPGPRVQPPSGDESYTELFILVSHSRSTPRSKAAREEIKEILRRKIAQLPRDYATVIRLCDLEGRTGEEAAAIMGRKHGAVRMLLLRSREHLRELLGPASNYFSDMV